MQVQSGLTSEMPATITISDSVITFNANGQVAADQARACCTVSSDDRHAWRCVVRQLTARLLCCHCSPLTLPLLQDIDISVLDSSIMFAPGSPAAGSFDLASNAWQTIAPSSQANSSNQVLFAVASYQLQKDFTPAAGVDTPRASHVSTHRCAAADRVMRYASESSLAEHSDMMSTPMMRPRHTVLARLLSVRHIVLTIPQAQAWPTGQQTSASTCRA